MSKYLLNKFLYTVDRDPDLVERYRDDPAGTVEWWEAEMANRLLNCTDGRADHLAGVHRRRARALREHDHVDAVRDGRAPVPHADPVHRHVRARPRAAGVPERLRPAMAHLRCPTPTSPPEPCAPPSSPAGHAAVVGDTRTRGRGRATPWSG